jgi:acyl-CoA thioesterase FadM
MSMTRRSIVTIPTDPSQFGPLQAKPRALLGLAMSGLSAWFAEHLGVSYSQLLTRHRIGFVFTNVHLDFAHPDVRFADADRLTASAHLTASDTAKYLHLEVDITAPPRAVGGRSRQVANYRADLRVVTIFEDVTLVGEPGLLPAWLHERFQPSEVYVPDRAAIARVSTAPSGKPLDAQGTTAITVLRSHCEVADQWSYPELLELMTAARESLFLDDTVPADVARLAVALPIRSTTAVFRRAMFVYDSCRVTTQAYLLEHHDGHDGAVMFSHEVHDSATSELCLTAWEILGPPSLPGG